MSGKRKKKKKKAKLGNIVGTLLLLGIVGYLVYYGVNNIFFVNNDTYSAEFNRYEVTSNHDAIVIRNEIVVKSSIAGETEFYAESGERVKRDEQIVKVSKLVDVANVEAGVTSTQTQVVQLDMEQTNAEIDNLRHSILFAIKEKKYEELQALSLALSVELSSKSRLLENEEVKSKQIVYYNPGDQSPVQVYKAPASGIVTYVADGFETVLNYDGLGLLDFDVIFSENLASIRTNQAVINAGDPVFKIIDNTKCYLLMKLKDDDISVFNNMSRCDIIINQKSYKGDVIDVYPTSAGGIAILRLPMVFDGFEKTRKLNVDVKLSDYQGIKIARTSLIKVDGVLGVYTVDVKRLISFTPVKILSEQTDNVIVYHESFFDDSGNMINTVKVKDTIVSDPTSVKIGSYLP